MIFLLSTPKHSQYYFFVDNAYVMRKLQILIFPWKVSAGWKRSATSGGNGQSFLPPVHDSNAPDLYIPVMSLITFAVVTAREDRAKQ